MMTYDEARAAVRGDREGDYGQQWRTHLDRYGPVAYFYELTGIMGRLESVLTSGDFSVQETEDVVLDKLIDLGNYAGFMFDWITEQRAKRSDQEFRANLP